MTSSRFYQSLALFCILASLYLLTYTGLPIAKDELALFSVTESWVRYGDTVMYSAYNFYPGAGDVPWQQSIYEPGQVVMAMPLYWLAYHLPIGGIQQTVWLFNIIITALIGVLIFHIGLRLQFSNSTSLITTLLVGSATALWPYSQTYFREPLFTLWILVSVYGILTWQTTKRYSALVITIVGVVGMLLTKDVGFLGLPALLIIGLPARLNRRVVGWYLLLLIGFILLGQLLGRVLLSSNIRFQSDVYIDRAETSSISYLLEVASAYLLSPGYSIWASSPLLLAGLLGAWQFYQRGRWQLALAPCVFLLMLVLGYGLGGREWHGGRGWGVRYLLTAVPLLSLWLLPVVEWAMARLQRWGALFPLIVASYAVQLAGVLVPLQRFYTIIEQRFPTQVPNAYFQQGAWELASTQWYIQLQHLKLDQTPIALHYADHAIYSLGWSLATIVAGAGILAVLRRGPRHLMVPVGMLSLSVICSAGFLLHNLRHDPRILADRAELHSLVAVLDEQASDQDIVYLSDPEYGPFFTNYYRGKAIYVVLPFSPGERESPNVPEPEVVDYDGSNSINFNERISGTIREALDYAISNKFDYLWLVTNRRPVDTWAYRPVEQFFTFHAYPITEVIYPDQNLSRLIQFGAQSAIYPPEITLHTPYQFGGHLQLVGYDFAIQASAGSYLPISLMWQPSGPIETDYHINVLLLNSAGVPVAQRGGIPQGTFGYMPSWYDQGLASRYPFFPEQHGLAIPSNLPAGDYQLQVVVYDWRDGSRPPVTFEDELIESSAATLGFVTILPPP